MSVWALLPLSSAVIGMPLADQRYQKLAVLIGYSLKVPGSDNRSGVNFFNGCGNGCITDFIWVPVQPTAEAATPATQGRTTICAGDYLVAA